MFFENEDFQKVMGKDNFLSIRSSLGFYPSYDHEVACKDPLWHCRHILKHLNFNSANIAVPVGAVSLDENTVRSSARCGAITYMKSESKKFGIRFYVITDWKNAYVPSLPDNGSGNKTNIPRSIHYCTQFRELRSLLENKLDNSGIRRDYASALWLIQLAHQSKLYRYSKGRLVVTDKFYTRHVLASELKRLTDGDFQMLGTVRLNLVDSIKRKNRKDAQEEIKTVPRVSWVLCQVYEKVYL